MSRHSLTAIIYEAHHTLPQKYRKQFEKLGINIDNPGNVVWREANGHRKKSNALTNDWDKFMSNHKGKPTKDQVINFRNQLEKKFLVIKVAIHLLISVY